MLQDLNYDEIVEEKQYNFWTLSSAIGGTMGLWTGLSCLALLQFVEVILTFNGLRIYF